MGVTAAAIIGLVGAGVSAYGASQAGKAGGAGRSVGELGSLPYGLQLQQARAYNDAQLDYDKQYAQLMLRMGPDFAAQQRQFNLLAAQDALGLYPKFAKAERKETSNTRAADVADLEKYGAGYVGAFAAGNPVYGALLDEAARGQTMTPLLQKLNIEALLAGRSPLGGLLEQEAIGDVLLGSTLSAEEQRDASQGARQAFAARGLNASPAAAATEILNRDAYGRERQQTRRNFGMGVMGLLGNENEANRRFELNVEGANTGQMAQWQNFLLGAEQATSRPLYTALATRAPAHIMGDVLGAMGMGMPVGTPSSIVSGAPSIYQGAQALTPLYNYGADVFNTNFNAAEARQIRQANAYSAIGSGLMSVGAGGM